MVKRVFKAVGITVIALIFSIIIGMVVSNPQDNFVIPEGTKFIAHRGHSSQHYENSEQAFLSAAKKDFFFAIETDVWLTNDGFWVCAHDANPFEDESLNIFDIPYNQAVSLPLKAVSDYNHDSEGIRLVSLKRFLEICYKYNKMAIVELKCTPNEQEISHLIDFVESVIPLKRVQFISFHIENITKIKNLDSQITVQTLSSNSLFVSLLRNGENVGINKNIVTRNFLEKIKEDVGTINVWTVNDEESVKELIDMGVDYITTDYIFEL